MYIEIDVSVVPPQTVLHQPDDFTTFKVVVRDVEHARVPIALLAELAGDRAGDPEWRRDLEKMLDYARAHGWLDDSGVRAHVERLS
jgi:hypothetical protein